MSQRKISKLHILIGLPGCGKTTFSKEYAQRNNAYVISFDEVQRGSRAMSYVSEQIKRIRTGEVILDGLFPSMKDVEDTLRCVVEFGKSTGNTVFTVDEIVIHHWAENREACLWNDRGRRDVDSTATIKGLSIEEVDEKEVERLFGIKTLKEVHEVIRKPDYEVMANEAGVVLVDGKYLQSATWSLGGTTRSWGGDIYPIDAETPPDFVELDNLLETICPAITFLQYKKLYRACVTVEDRDASDYYSDCREAFYCCDMEKLYEMLFEMGIYSV